MPDSKITALTALTAADPAVDMFPVVDVSDTTMAASGTTKRISINNILACSPAATLASLNVTGSSIPANGLYLPTTNTLEFAANSLAQYRIAPLGVFSWYDGAGGTRMTLNSTGLGVGRIPTSFASTLKVIQIGDAGSSSFTGRTDAFQNNLVLNAYDSGSNAWIYIQSTLATRYSQNSGSHVWYTAPSGTAGNAITFTQAMTLDASGNLLVGTTTTSGNAGGLKLSNVGGTLGQITFSNNSGVADYVARFNYGSTPTLVGTITVASGGTTYNTTSDYRLKESVQPLVGGLARVSALKPSIYKWKSDGSSGEGFLAHELAEVVPFAVTGEKDAVNEDGSVKAQGVDMSRVVPILVAAIQELAARVQTLEAK